jgi:hypothetical protein
LQILLKRARLTSGRPSFFCLKTSFILWICLLVQFTAEGVQQRKQHKSYFKIDIKESEIVTFSLDLCNRVLTIIETESEV